MTIFNTNLILGYHAVANNNNNNNKCLVRNDAVANIEFATANDVSPVQPVTPVGEPLGYGISPSQTPAKPSID